VKTDLDPAQRAGFLTTPGFLAAYASGNDPDIIHRGVFIATRLLCAQLPAPAPNIPPLAEVQPNQTNRERIEAQTGKGTCGGVCHATLFNPLGYAFENYDAIGRFRTTDRGKPVNAADSYTLDGQLRSFQSGVELSHMLAESQQAHGCYLKNMLTYLHGRQLAAEEQPVVDSYTGLSTSGTVSLRDLVLTIVTSDSFLTRLP
jgi:hypothetical protein